MTLEEFLASIESRTPPPVADTLRALWHDARGDWDAAHSVAQDVHSDEGSWVHAYLHRKEGDPSNAAYWYRRAGRPVACGPLEAEWKASAAELLRRSRQG